MHLVKDGGHYFFQFEALNRCHGLWHGVTTRHGGVSRPPYDSLNLSHGVNDDPQAVRVNRNRLHALSGARLHVYARQEHGTAIQVITRKALCEPRIIQPLPAADALITDVAGVVLVIQTADCQAVMIYDPQRGVVANVHCGWRGSVADIVGLTVKRMVDRFGCDPGNMVAAIGPSLGPCCAEFIHYRAEIPSSLWPFRVNANHFDFWRISRRQLIAVGLMDANVHCADICTRCNAGLFFSYRARHSTGRFAALIGMTQ